VGHTFAFIILDIAVIIVVARLFGRLARKLNQPAVIGEIVAGIALGPSLLGLLPGDVDGLLFPAEVIPYLNILAKLGLVLFMFIVGLELDMALIRGRGQRAGVISLSSIVLPFALGAAATLLLHPLHDTVDGKKVSLLALMLFMGVAMSITAFPVLARILTDRGMHRTSVGVIALAAAAIDDVVAWTLLAFVYAVASGNSPLAVVRIVALTAVFAAVMFLIVKPLLARMPDWYKSSGRITPDIFAVVLVGILLSALATERIGIHEIFGAFVFGAIMPREGAQEFTREVLERLEQISVSLLLPIFFVIAGFGVDLTKFRDVGLIWQLLLILTVAIVGKFVGAFVGAQLQRMPTRQSAAVGVLMNTRGLTELVILLVGKQLGVLDTAMFTMMVVMALLTTIMTGPLLQIVYPPKVVERDIEAAERAALGTPQTYRVLVLADSAPNALTDRMLRLADAALAGRQPGEILLSRFLMADDTTMLEVGSGGLPDLAALAEAVDGLKRYLAEVDATSAAVRPLCRFGSAGGDDLLRQIVSTEADVAVISEDWVRRHPEAYSALDGVAVLIVPAESPSVWLQSGNSSAVGVSEDSLIARDDGTATGARAVVMAARAALRSGRSLSIVVADGDARTQRRLQHGLEPMESTGVTMSVGSAGQCIAIEQGAVLAAARLEDRAGRSEAGLRDDVTEVVDQLQPKV
jgi:Kef-type K+ transport system membrane component KefB